MRPANCRFLDNHIREPNFGALVRALIYLWDRERDADWKGRLVFLPAPPG